MGFRRYAGQCAFRAGPTQILRQGVHSAALIASARLTVSRALGRVARRRLFATFFASTHVVAASGRMACPDLVSSSATALGCRAPTED
jgi:hypothetical protein